jgi:hypothetical protein
VYGGQTRSEARRKRRGKHNRRQPARSLALAQGILGPRHPSSRDFSRPFGGEGLPFKVFDIAVQHLYRNILSSDTVGCEVGIDCDFFCQH